MEHITKIIDSLAWPITILIIIWMLKSEIAKLLSRISNLKWKDTEASFSKGVKELEEQVSHIENDSPQKAPTPEQQNQSKDTLSYYLNLADLSPRSAISEAWIEIERVANRLALKFQLSPDRRPVISIVIKILMEESLFSPYLLEAYYSARRLRNEATHAPDFTISQDEVEKYITLILSLAEKLKAAELILEDKEPNQNMEPTVKTPAE